MGARTLRIALLLPLVLALGCSDDDDSTTRPDPGPMPEYLERTSPGNVLANLQEAYRFQDIDGYVDQLDPSFVFIPNVDDDGVDFVELRYEEDVASTTNMFENVDRIEITLTHGAAGPSDFVEYPASEGYQIVDVSSVRLDVTTREIIDGEPLIYQVGGDRATFIFKPDMSVSPVTYRIAYQQDDS